MPGPFTGKPVYPDVVARFTLLGLAGFDCFRRSRILHQRFVIGTISKTWSVVGLALLCFVAGTWSVLVSTTDKGESGKQPYLSMMYHTKPGKAGELESMFRDVAKLQAQHSLNVVGY